MKATITVWDADGVIVSSATGAMRASMNYVMEQFNAFMEKKGYSDTAKRGNGTDTKFELIITPLEDPTEATLKS